VDGTLSVVGSTKGNRAERGLAIGTTRLAIDRFGATVEPLVENEEKSRKMPLQPMPKSAH